MSAIPEPELPRRFGMDQRALAAANIMRRQLHAEPAHPVEYGCQFEYAEVLPSLVGLPSGWLWIADSGRFERPFLAGALAVMAVHRMRDLLPGERLWMHLYPEPMQTGVGIDPRTLVMQPWVSIDTERQDYAIWKTTGALYESDPWEGVADDPIWVPPAEAVEKLTGVTPFDLPGPPSL
ncbi:MAG: hypothetical protein QOF36_2580 [Microbacteriaceae bacterium]|jgi:hypothetical protein|nr:hypothetical protein [Microbacteriaceae bacterium]